MELVEHLLYEPDDTGILWIKFNRPERMNALAPDTVAKVAEYMRAGDDDPNVRVIVLTGVGRGFCAGADMKAMGDASAEHREDPGPDGYRRSFGRLQQQFKGISETRKPTIAMVNGAAAGGGFDMALHCDLRVGSENARFITYQNMGQIIENGGLYFLPRIIGLGRTFELLYATGGTIGAEDAHRWGLLNRLVPADRLEAETRDICAKIIGSPPLAQWIGKRILRRAVDSDLDTTFDLAANASGILATSEDAGEARAAFLGKRTPVFKGR